MSDGTIQSAPGAFSEAYCLSYQVNNVQAASGYGLHLVTISPCAALGTDAKTWRVYDSSGNLVTGSGCNGDANALTSANCTRIRDLSGALMGYTLSVIALGAYMMAAI